MRRLASAAACLAVAASLGVGLASAPRAAGADAIADGKKVATDRRKGNCVACHMMDNQPLPGNMGPPLVGMKARFPDRAALRDHIWDATKRNPQTQMPPFGKHLLLNDAEIDAIVDYLLTL